MGIPLAAASYSSSCSHVAAWALVVAVSAVPEPVHREAAGCSWKKGSRLSRSGKEGALARRGEGRSRYRRGSRG